MTQSSSEKRQRGVVVHTVPVKLANAEPGGRREVKTEPTSGAAVAARLRYWDRVAAALTALLMVGCEVKPAVEPDKYPHVPAMSLVLPVGIALFLSGTAFLVWHWRATGKPY